MQNHNQTRTGSMQRVRQSWAQFRQSGSVADYLHYRACCRFAEGESYADTSDRQGRCAS